MKKGSASVIERSAIPDKKQKKARKTPFDLIFERCKNEIKLPNAALERLPAKWELLGDVLVLRLDEDLKKYWKGLAGVYAEVLNAKTVLRRVDKVQGIYRVPGVELVLGNDTQTVHVENHVRFKFDALKIMFSSGNIDERIRISKVVNKDDVIVDMFSGIGYFTLPIALHSKPARIIACELNPIAYEYLCQNIELNNVTGVVEPLLGDNRTIVPEKVANRVIMGYLKSEHSHRLAAFKTLRPSGGTIHFHDVGFKKDVKQSAYEKIRGSLYTSGFDKKFVPELKNFYRIKSYGPKLDHVVLDIYLKES